MTSRDRVLTDLFSRYAATTAANLTAAVVLFLGVRWYVLDQVEKFKKNLPHPPVASATAPEMPNDAPLPEPFKGN